MNKSQGSVKELSRLMVEVTELIMNLCVRVGKLECARLHETTSNSQTIPQSQDITGVTESTSESM